MALIRAIAADNEVSTNTELVVTSALAFPVSLFLPAIAAGAGATVADDFKVTVYANSTGGIYVKDATGHLVGFVAPGTAKTFDAQGDATANRWNMVECEDVMQLKAAQELAVGGGAAIAFGATTPGTIATPAAVNRFMKIVLSDGTFGYIPVWK